MPCSICRRKSAKVTSSLNESFIPLANCYFSQHVLTHRKIPCDILGCKAQFGNRRQLYRHKRTARAHRQDQKGAYSCPKCGQDFSRRDNLRRHQNRTLACSPDQVAFVNGTLDGADVTSDDGIATMVSSDGSSLPITPLMIGEFGC
jgi:predicted RNA-binding Zn-ribbon protein involved in translation (DUF1610 family)